MTKKRPSVPIGLPIAVAVLLVIGFSFTPVMRLIITPEELNKQIFLGAVPFLSVFVAIVLAFISVIWLMASVLNNNISARIHRPIEGIMIAGIVLGVFGMLQPWLFILYRLGFPLLLFSTLAFILWSHIIPKEVHRQTHLGSISISELEQRDSGG